MNSVCWDVSEPIPYVHCGEMLSYEQFRAKYDPKDSYHNRRKALILPEPYAISC